jgi:hypothetical protein
MLACSPRGKLGIAEIPVMVAAGWTEAQKRAYVLADNQLCSMMEMGIDRILFSVGYPFGRWARPERANFLEGGVRISTGGRGCVKTRPAGGRRRIM